MTTGSRSRNRGGKSVSDLLKTRSNGLGSLLQQARKLAFIEQKLASLLEPAISAQVRVAALREDRLVLLTPSAALATRLRQDSDHLLRSLLAGGIGGITQIQVRVAPLPQPVNEKRKKRQLPEAGRQSLERFAKDSGDEEICDLVMTRKQKDPDI